MMCARQIAQHAPRTDDELVAGTMAEIVVDVLEVIDIEEQQRTHARRLHRRLDAELQAVAVRQIGELVVHRKMLDAQRREMLFGDVPRRAADAEHLAVFVVRYARIDSDPAILASGRHQMGDVILDFTCPLERGEKAPVRDV
jgi:hypothetical protein